MTLLAKVVRRLNGLRRKGVKTSRRAYARERSRLRSIRVKLRVSMGTGALALEPSAQLFVPLVCDGNGSVAIGEGVILGNPVGPCFGDGSIKLQARRPDSVVRIGPQCAISNNVTVIANELVEIGASCIIGDQVAIYDSDFHEIRRADRDGRLGKVEAVLIGDGVWLGSRVMILKGVEIGSNSVIASGAVVTEDIPGNVIAGGVPAKVLRSIV